MQDIEGNEFCLDRAATLDIPRPMNPSTVLVGDHRNVDQA